MGTLETVQKLCTILDSREGETRGYEARWRSHSVVATALVSSG